MRLSHSERSERSRPRLSRRDASPCLRRGQHDARKICKLNYDAVYKEKYDESDQYQQYTIYHRERKMRKIWPWLGVGLLTLAGLPAVAMPPHPDLLARLQRDGRLQEYIAMRREALARGVDAPFEFDRSRLERDNRDEVEIRVICILADFADQTADTVRYTREHFQSMLFSEGEYDGGSMRDWYLENSYGNTNIIGEVHGWYRMPQDYAYYCNEQYGFGEFPRNAQGLVRDALLAADGDVDFRNFDNDDNHVVEALFVVHAGPGAESTGSRRDIWSHAWNVPEYVRCDEMRFASYAMEPENGNIGVFGHELAHSLFGLPDLYDTEYESAGVGVWSMMAGGSWGGGGRRPVHFDAWCKSRIGFADPFPIVENSRRVQLLPVENEPNILMVWRLNDFGRQYFLVENRQRIGFDASLPAGGMLIWHIDESMPDNSHPWWPGAPGALHNIVALEQADGEYHLERNRNGGDGGDPWPGATFNEDFNDDSVPDARDYFRRETDVRIANIEQENDRSMHCDIWVTPGVSPEELNLFLLERIPVSHRFPHPDMRNDTAMTDEITLVSQLLAGLSVEIDGRGRELPDNIFNYNVLLYIESWRDEENPDSGLSEAEQRQMMTFLNLGKKIILVGPDIACNIHSDQLLWSYLSAEFGDDGQPRQTGNIRRLTANPDARFAGQNFVYMYRSACDHFIDVVNPVGEAKYLYTDQSDRMRGLTYTGNSGCRIILQPFLFGGMVDWGGSKQTLLMHYFHYLRFNVAPASAPLRRETLQQQIQLLTAYPNPFNGRLVINRMGSLNDSRLTIFNNRGRSVGSLWFEAGAGQLVWQPQWLAAGSYFIVPDSRTSARPLRIEYVK